MRKKSNRTFGENKPNFQKTAMEKIKAIIFDWGGVLIDDPRPALMQYCAEAFDVPVNIYTQTHDKFLEDFQKGLISEESFWEKICKELKKPKPVQNSLWGDAFRAAYSSQSEVFAFAAELHNKGYKTALLSNTEVPAMVFCRELGYDMFDELIFSCAEGAAKPEKKIYDIVVSKLNLKPEQAVLIDDKAEFINGAKKAGLEGIVFKNLNQVKKELEKFLAPGFTGGSVR
jgi:epoxide hydrolase-like predicted phosphatase